MQHIPGARRDGTLIVQCWCKATTVNVPPAEVRAGITRSCGSEQCTRTHAAMQCAVGSL